jgi:hypothetical protein
MKYKVASIALFTFVALLGLALSAEAGGRRSSFGFGVGNRGYYVPYSYASPGYYPFGTYPYYSPFGTYRSYYPFGTYQQYYPFGSYSVPSYWPYLAGPVVGYTLTPSPAPGYRSYIPRRGDGRHYGSYVPRKYYRRNY